jgi:hypothetical protein
MIKQPSRSRRAISSLMAMAVMVLAPLSAQSKPWRSVAPGNEAFPPLQWTNSEDKQHTPTSKGLRWRAMDRQPSADDEVAPSQTVLWQDTPPGEVITADDIAPQEETQDEPLVVIEPSGTTFANDKAIWRDEQWHPQISSMVPVGFGPKGWMLTAGIFGIDCTASGVCEQPDSWDEYQNQIESFGEAQFDLSLGMGDAEKTVGLTLTASFEETKLPFGDRNTQGLETDANIFDEYYIGAHLSRNIGPDTSVRVGIKNWIDVKQCGLSCGFPKSAYGVISQRIRMNSDQESWFPNAYLTVGVGNGEFRPLDEQVRASIAAQRAAGCQTYGYIPDKPCNTNTLRRAVLGAANYGQLTPIGAAALEIYPGFNAIGEWSGRNLNLGFSVKPFEEFGLVFTSMWNNLIANCDWGCDISVPDQKGRIPLPENMITYRPAWSFTASINLKF